MSLKECQGVRVEVDVRFRGGGQSRSMSGRVTDLSANGLFLATKQPVPLGLQPRQRAENQWILGALLGQPAPGQGPGSVG